MDDDFDYYLMYEEDTLGFRGCLICAQAITDGTVVTECLDLVCTDCIYWYIFEMGNYCCPGCSRDLRPNPELFLRRVNPMTMDKYLEVVDEPMNSMHLEYIDFNVFEIVKNLEMPIIPNEYSEIMREPVERGEAAATMEGVDQMHNSAECSEIRREPVESDETATKEGVDQKQNSSESSENAES